MGRGGRYLTGRLPWAGLRLARPTFGQPGNGVGSPAFGRITNTRFATSESGSSRQIQLAARVLF